MRKIIFLILGLLITNLVNAIGEFITIWKTDNMTGAVTSTTQVAFPAIGSNYSVYWEDVANPAINGTITGLTSTYQNPAILTFPAASTYKLVVSSGQITGFSSMPATPDKYDEEKLLSLEQWGTTNWTTLDAAFAHYKNFNYNATDIPNLSNVTNLSYMFWDTPLFTGNTTINSWDVSTITNMSWMFANATLFNQPLSD